MPKWRLGLLLDIFVSLVENTYLLLLFIEVIYDDSNKEIESEERSKDNEEHKVDVHSNIDFSDWLISDLKYRKDSNWFYKIFQRVEKLKTFRMLEIVIFKIFNVFHPFSFLKLRECSYVCM